MDDKIAKIKILPNHHLKATDSNILKYPKVIIVRKKQQLTNTSVSRKYLRIVIVKTTQILNIKQAQKKEESGKWK